HHPGHPTGHLLRVLQPTLAVAARKPGLPVVPAARAPFSVEPFLVATAEHPTQWAPGVSATVSDAAHLQPATFYSADRSSAGNRHPWLLEPGHLLVLPEPASAAAAPAVHKHDPDRRCTTAPHPVYRLRRVPGVAPPLCRSSSCSRRRALYRRQYHPAEN